MSGEILWHINHPLSGEQWELLHCWKSWMSAGINSKPSRSQLLLLLPSCQNSLSSPLTSIGNGGNASPHLNIYLYYHLLPFIHSQDHLIEMKTISWQCWCPQTNPTDGFPLRPEVQGLSCSQSDTHIPFVSPLRFRLCSYSAKIFDDEIAKRNSREHNTNVSLPHSLGGLCSSSSVDWSTTRCYNTWPIPLFRLLPQTPEAGLEAWRGQKRLHFSTMNGMAQFYIY